MAPMNMVIHMVMCSVMPLVLAFPVSQGSTSSSSESYNSEAKETTSARGPRSGPQRGSSYLHPIHILESSTVKPASNSPQVLQGGSSQAGPFVPDNDPIEFDHRPEGKYHDMSRIYKIKYRVRELLRRSPNSRKARDIMEREGWTMEDVQVKKKKLDSKLDKHRRNLMLSRITSLRNAITEFDTRHELKSTKGYYRQKPRGTIDSKPPARSAEHARAIDDAEQMMEYIKDTMYIFRKNASDTQLIERVAAINQWMNDNMSQPFQEVKLPNLPCFQIEDLEGSFEDLHFTQKYLPVPEEGPRRDQYVASMFGDDEEEEAEATEALAEDDHEQQESSGSPPSTAVVNYDDEEE